MTQLTNDYIYEILGGQGYTAGDDIFIFAGAATTQQAALPLKGQLHRIVTNKTANAALALKSILSNDNPGIVFVINDDPTNAVVVFPFKAFGAGATDTGENINGVATGFTIPAVTTAVFFSSLVQAKRKGGTSGSTPALNWSAATFS